MLSKMGSGRLKQLSAAVPSQFTAAPVKVLPKASSPSQQDPATGTRNLRGCCLCHRNLPGTTHQTGDYEVPRVT